MAVTITKITRIISSWTPPGNSLPTPIIIAHDKSNVRKGCAEVLYNEIINNSTGKDHLDNLIRSKLQMDVHI